MSPEEFVDSFARAQKAELIGNFGYAETLCASILRAKPDEHRARLLLRRCQMARFRQKHGSYRPQLKIAGSGIFFSPKPSADALRDAEVAEASLKENPCEETANQLLLHASERLGWAEIEQLCRDVIAEGAPTPENLMNKAKGFRKQKQFDRAIAVLEKAQQQFGGNLTIDKMLRDTQAEKAAHSGWETARDFTELLAPGQTAQADEAQRLAAAIEKDPANLSLVDKLIALLEHRAEAQTVIEWINYRRNIEDQPVLRRKAFDLERRLGTLSLEREMEELEHFVKEHPTDLDLRLALGSALLRRGDSKRAILQLQTARKHGKITVRVEALAALAQAYDNVGLQKLGERSRTRALDMTGEDEALKKEILYQMALSLEMQEKTEEARARWMELFELDAGFKDTVDHVLPPGSSSLLPAMLKRCLPALLALLIALPGHAQGPPPAPANPPRLPPKFILDTEYTSFGLPVVAQGDRDVCSLFAITALAEFEYARSAPTAPHPRLSQEYLIWAAKAASGKTREQSMFWEATFGLNKEGICFSDLMPYSMKPDPGRKPSAEAIRNAHELSERWKVHTIKRWNLTEPLSARQIFEIKHAISEGHPVASGMRWPKQLKGSDLLTVPPANAVEDGHSIVLSGYEDNPGSPGGGFFHFRNSFGDHWGQDGYGRMSYGYAEAYANDVLWLKFEAPGAETPARRYEAESLPITRAQRCQTSVQKMDDYEGALWSHHEQLFCNVEKGGDVVLRFEVPDPGSYRLRLLATAAPDFGRIRIAVDGKPTGPEVDLYAGRVSPSGALELGVHELGAGIHQLQVTSVGKNALSAGFSFGLDALDLLVPK